MDNRVPVAIIVDHGQQGVPVLKAISVHVDQIVLGGRATDSQVALVEIMNGVVTGAQIELEVVIVWSTPKSSLPPPPSSLSFPPIIEPGEDGT